jgi:hypothetical protein
MDKLRNEGLMATIVHELEELKNCQKAIMQKLAKIEVANLRLDNENLEALLPELFAITNFLEEFLNQKKEPKPADNVVDLMQAS